MLSVVKHAERVIDVLPEHAAVIEYLREQVFVFALRANDIKRAEA